MNSYQDDNKEKRKTTIILVGGGHAHIQVMKYFLNNINKEDNIKIKLISDNEYSFYSGMLPGSISNLYCLVIGL